jgi:hypothetical protein
LPTANTPVTLIPKVPTKDLLNKETRNLVWLLNRCRRTFIAADALNSDPNREAQDKEHEWVLKHLHLNPKPKKCKQKGFESKEWNSEGEPKIWTWKAVHLNSIAKEGKVPFP